MGGKIKSTKWYGRFWPPERRRVKMMQAIYDYYEPEIQKKTEEALRNHLIYGIPMPDPKPQQGEK